MATENPENTETTDGKAAAERDETPASKQNEETSAVKAGKEDAGEDAGKKDAATEDGNGTEDTATGASDADASDSEGDGFEETPAGPASAGGGFVAGAGAVVSAGLGICSLTGTSLGEMLRSRKELIGQIESSGNTPEEQVTAFYNAPWHVAAAINGLFALVAVVLGGALLALYVQREDTRPWVKAVALSGVILGFLGLLVALGMYFDLFANTPELPETPQPPS